MSYARSAVTRMTLDMSRLDLQRSETVTQDDTNRRWEVTLINGGAPFRLPPNWTAALTGIKPDGNGLLNGCSVVDGKIIYDFAAGKEIATCVGGYPAQFDIWDEVGELVASPKVYINVLADVRPREGMKSESEYGLLGEFIAQKDDLTEDIKNNTTQIGNNTTQIGNLSERMTQAEDDIDILTNTSLNQGDDITALKKKVTTAGTVTIPATEWMDFAPAVASAKISDAGRGSIILMLPADEETRLAANSARLSAYPTAFAIADGSSGVTILRAEAEKAPDADMTFAYAVIKTGDDSRDPMAAIIGVDAYGEGGGGSASGVDEDAVKALIDEEVPEWARSKTKPTYTPEEVKARPATWTPTAEEIGARPNTWTPTAADVGADPANTAQTLVNDLARKTAQDLANYYTKDQTLTKDEINTLVSAIPKFKIEVVTSLPSSNISETTVYLVKSGADTSNLYTEYIHANDAWERLGTQTVDLTGYATEALVNTLLAAYVKTADMEAYVAGLLKAYITKAVADKTYQPKGDYLTTADAPAIINTEVNKVVTERKEELRGEPGEDGATPYIGANGNWWVGDTDTGKNAAKVKWDTVTVFDESIADTDTLYILPDGSIKMYAYVEEGGGEPLFTNLADPTDSSWKSSSRLKTGSGTAVVGDAVYEKDKSVVTNIINAKLDDYIYISGLDTSARTDATATQFSVIFYDAEGTTVNVQPFVLKLPACGEGNVLSGCRCWDAVETDENGVSKWRFAYNNAGISTYTKMVSLQVGGVTTDGPDGVIVTVNDPIEYTEPYKGYKWITADFKISSCECSEDVVKLKTHVNNLQKQVNNLLEAVALPDQKPVWYAFGDSITEGSVSYITADGTPGSKVTPSLEQGWVYTTERVCGFDLTNYGVGGSGYAYCINDQTPDAKTIISGVDFSACDLVTLAWGINDWKSDRASMGALDDDKDAGTTPCAALKWCIEHIQAANPLCKIIVITPLNIVRGNEGCFWAINYNLPNTGTLGDFCDKIAEICEHYGVTCVDMTHNSIITRLNIKTMLLDNIHPTADAHKVIGHEIAGRLGYR